MTDSHFYVWCLILNTEKTQKLQWNNLNFSEMVKWTNNTLKHIKRKLVYILYSQQLVNIVAKINEQPSMVKRITMTYIITGQEEGILKFTEINAV